MGVAVHGQADLAVAEDLNRHPTSRQPPSLSNLKTRKYTEILVPNLNLLDRQYIFHALIFSWAHRAPGMEIEQPESSRINDQIGMNNPLSTSHHKNRRQAVFFPFSPVTLFLPATSRIHNSTSPTGPLPCEPPKDAVQSTPSPHNPFSQARSYSGGPAGPPQSRRTASAVSAVVPTPGKSRLRPPKSGSVTPPPTRIPYSRPTRRENSD